MSKERYSQDFLKSEFACKGNCIACPHREDNEMAEVFIEKIQKARDISREIHPPNGVPFRIFSGIRCQTHNRNIGSVASRSTHVPQVFENKKAYGADIETRTLSERFVILKSLLAAGFTRIGINRSTIHVDCADIDSRHHPSDVIWTYYK